MWGRDHTRLQTVAVYLWAVPNDCRSLVAEAGLDSSKMVFSDPPSLFWESVILQCEKQESLRTLVPVLLSRYPNNRQLQEAVEPWINLPEQPPRAKTKQEPVPEPEPKPEPVEVVTETPTTITRTTQIQKGSAPSTSSGAEAVGERSRTAPTKGKPLDASADDELVTVRVPKEFADDAVIALVATVRSLREAVSTHEKTINELVAWRKAISTMSRAEVAERVGGNEPGADKVDPVVLDKEKENGKHPDPTIQHPG